MRYRRRIFTENPSGSWLTLGLYRMRVLAEKQAEREVLRASGKAVWTWPPVGAVDAGPMQIQLRKGVSVRCAEAVLWSATHYTAGAEDWLGRKSSAKTVVGEGARRDLAGSETGR